MVAQHSSTVKLSRAGRVSVNFLRSSILPRATARVPTLHHPNPRPYHDQDRGGGAFIAASHARPDLSHPYHDQDRGGGAFIVGAGGGVDEWWGPLRSPWGFSTPELDAHPSGTCPQKRSLPIQNFYACHSERSEESPPAPREILRCAQNDRRNCCLFRAN